MNNNLITTTRDFPGKSVLIIKQKKLLPSKGIRHFPSGNQTARPGNSNDVK